MESVEVWGLDWIGWSYPAREGKADLVHVGGRWPGASPVKRVGL